MSTLTEDIKAAAIDSNMLRLWYAGSATMVLKSGDTIAITDPFLVDGAPGRDWSRRSPSLIAPGELGADLVLVTHSHSDHCDAESLAPFFENPETQILLSPVAYSRVLEMGIDRHGTAVEVRPGSCAHSGPITVHVLPGGDVEEEEAVAFLIVSNSCSVIHPGDSLREDAYKLYAPYRLGMILIPFGDKLGERVVYPDAEAFRRLVVSAEASTAVPFHWDLRESTFLDPAQAFGDDDRVTVLQPGQSMDVPKRRK